MVRSGGGVRVGDFAGADRFGVLGWGYVDFVLVDCGGGSGWLYVEDPACGAGQHADGAHVDEYVVVLHGVVAVYEVLLECPRE